MHDEEYERYLNTLNEMAGNAQPEGQSQEALLQQIAMLTQQMNAMTQQMAMMQQQLAGQKQRSNSNSQQRESREPTALQLLEELRRDYAKSKNGKLTPRHFIILRNPEVQKLMTSNDIDMIGGWRVPDEHNRPIKGLMQCAARLGYPDAQMELCRFFWNNNTIFVGPISYEDFKFSAEAIINDHRTLFTRQLIYDVVIPYFQEVVLRGNISFEDVGEWLNDLLMKLSSSEGIYCIRQCIELMVYKNKLPINQVAKCIDHINMAYAKYLLGNVYLSHDSYLDMPKARVYFLQALKLNRNPQLYDGSSGVNLEEIIKGINRARWKFIYTYHEGLARVQNEQLQFGFVDEKGEEVIPCQWKLAKDFSGGLAPVKNEQDKWGYIDKTGKVVIPYQFKDAESFDGGWAHIVSEHWGSGLINHDVSHFIPDK